MEERSFEAGEDTREFAGFGTRLWAWGVDTLLLTLLVTPLLLLIYGRPYLDHYLFALEEGGLGIYGVWEGLLAYVLPVVGVYLFWLVRGATPGKMAVSVRIEDARSGAPATPVQLLLRLIGIFLSALPLGAGFLWIAFDRRRQGLHDKLARTVVVVDRGSLPTSDAVAEAKRVIPTGTGNVGADRPASPLHLLLFRVGTSVLLLATFASAVLRFRGTDLALAVPSPTRRELRDSGLLPLPVEITLYHTGTVAAALAAILGLVLIWWAGRRREARILALLLGFFSFHLHSRVLIPLGVAAELRSLASTLAGWLAVAAFLRLVTVFPRRLEAGELARHRRLDASGPVRRSGAWMASLFRGPKPTTTPPAVLGPGLLGLLLSPRWVWGGAVTIGLGIHLLPPRPELIDLGIFLGIIGLLLAGAHVLRLNLSLAAPEERRRGLWLTYGLLLTVIGPLLLGVAGVALSTVTHLFGVPLLSSGDLAELLGILTMTLFLELFPLILVLTIAFAIFYRGELDPGFAIRKTTLYGALGVLGMLVFTGVEHLLSTHLTRILPIPGSASGFVSAMLGAGTVGLFRSRIRTRADAAVHRFMNPEEGGDRSPTPSAPEGQVTSE